MNKYIFSMENAIKEFLYRVQDNDTLMSVSTKFEIPFTEIISLNNLSSEIEVGDVLLLSYGKGKYYKVELKETAKSIAEKFGIEEQKLLAVNKIDYVFYGLTLLIPQ